MYLNAQFDPCSDTNSITIIDDILVDWGVVRSEPRAIVGQAQKYLAKKRVICERIPCCL